MGTLIDGCPAQFSQLAAQGKDLARLANRGVIRSNPPKARSQEPSTGRDHAQRDPPLAIADQPAFIEDTTGEDARMVTTSMLDMPAHVIATAKRLIERPSR